MKKRRIIRDIAIQRIKLLYKYAVREVRKGNVRLAQRYMYIAKRIAGKAGIKVPRSIKRAVCKNCLTPLIPGITSRVRLKSEGKGSRIVVTCLICGWIHRYPYKLGKKRVQK